MAGRPTITKGSSEANETIINVAGSMNMFLSGTVTGPGSDPADRVAGLNIFEFEIITGRLLDIDLPKTTVGQAIRDGLRDTKKAFDPSASYEGVDPLVLDLDGDGIELTAMSAVAPMFDLDGDEFSEPVGWLMPDDGLLAIDLNANGLIDDITELFGAPGISGFTELAALDSNSDGVIDALDDDFGLLRVWRDLNANAETDAGELFTLADAGPQAITALSLSATPTDPANPEQISGNVIAERASFTWADASTGELADVVFRVDNFNSEFLGDTTVSAAAAARPDLKGYGILTDLRVAMTLDSSLVATVDSYLAGAPTGPDLGALRAAAMPVLAGWADASPASGSVGSNSDIPILVDRSGGGATLSDFAILVTDGQGSFWALASGADVLDAQSEVIERPTYQEVIDQSPAAGGWETLSGDQISFIEHHLGESIPFEDATPGSQAVADDFATGQLSSMLEFIIDRIDLMSVRLAVQGPLASEFFADVSYDAAEDAFTPDTIRQLIPTFEAIFDAAPADVPGALAYLADWKPILDIVIGDYDRGEGQLKNSYGFLFANIVAAFESTGVAPDIKATAEALGILEDLIVTGSGTLVGNVNAINDDIDDIFYITAGVTTAEGGGGFDNYVFGKNFGAVVIDDVEPPLSGHSADVIRFADTTAGEVTAARDGLDMVLTVTATGNTVRIIDQFQGRNPDLFGSDLSDDTGVSEVIFSDAVVWDRIDIARAVSAPDLTAGTPDIDFLDGGADGAPDTFSGGDSDVYVFAPGYGNDTIDEGATNELLGGPDFVEFGGGLAWSDLSIARTVGTDDLVFTIDASGETLTIVDQFHALYVGVTNPVNWFDRIELFTFDDGNIMQWDDIMPLLTAQAKTAGDDTIIGFDFADTLDGGAGDDLLSGGNENDTYVFGLGYGSDVIDEANDNLLSGQTDTVRFDGAITFADASFARDGDSDDLTITLADGSSLLIEGQFDALFTGFGTEWFDRIEQFDFADGAGGRTVYDQTQIIDHVRALNSTAGDDQLYGFQIASETLDAGAGDDYISGGNGSDYYVWGTGSGNDTIEEGLDNILSGGDDAIELSADLTSADVSVGMGGNAYDIVLTIGAPGSEETLRIVNQNYYNSLATRFDQIEEVRFNDGSGTVWDPQDLRDMALVSQFTAGDDEVFGFHTDDTIEAGAGDDVLRGGDGSDTYVLNIGDGHDRIEEEVRYITYSSDDTISLGAGFTPANTRFYQAGNDLIVASDTGNESVRVVKHFFSTYLDIEQVVFADTTTLDQAASRRAGRPARHPLRHLWRHRAVGDHHGLERYRRARRRRRR